MIWAYSLPAGWDRWILKNIHTLRLKLAITCISPIMMIHPLMFCYGAIWTIVPLMKNLYISMVNGDGFTVREWQRTRAAWQ